MDCSNHKPSGEHGNWSRIVNIRLSNFLALVRLKLESLFIERLDVDALFVKEIANIIVGYITRDIYREAILLEYGF